MQNYSGRYSNFCSSVGLTPPEEDRDGLADFLENIFVVLIFAKTLLDFTALALIL